MNQASTILLVWGWFAKGGVGVGGGGWLRIRHVEYLTLSVQVYQLFPLITFTQDTIVEIYNLYLYHNSYNSYRDDSQCSVVRKKLSDKLGYKLRPFHQRM